MRKSRFFTFCGWVFVVWLGLLFGMEFSDHFGHASATLSILTIFPGSVIALLAVLLWLVGTVAFAIQRQGAGSAALRLAAQREAAARRPSVVAPSYVPGNYIPCPTCKGEGHVGMTTMVLDPVRSCPQCKGLGRVPPDWNAVAQAK